MLPSRTSSVASLLAGVITQNVDGLHQAAGARQVLDLHGRLDRVVCLECGERSPRDHLDLRLRQANPQCEAAAERIQPDGDAVVAAADVARFQVVGCESCGGLLKPDVVFFGENVPRSRAERCYALVDAPDLAGPRARR